MSESQPAGEETASIRPTPTHPSNYLLIGVALSFLGGLIIGLWHDAQALGALVLAVGGVIGGIGVIGQGVLMAMRYANHEEYLHLLVEQGNLDDE